MFEEHFISGHKLKNLWGIFHCVISLSHSASTLRLKAMSSDWSDLRNYITTLYGTISTNSAAAGGF